MKYEFKKKKVNESLTLTEVFSNWENANNCDCNGGCRCSASASARR